jgi:hypothetical protein
MSEPCRECGEVEDDMTVDYDGRIICWDCKNWIEIGDIP